MRMNWGPKTYEESATLWVERIGKARRMAPKIEHYHEVHFEDLVRDTEGTLRKVCEIIELDFDPAMLDYHERAEKRLAGEERRPRPPPRPNPARRGADGVTQAREGAAAQGPPEAWREKMTPEEIASYEKIAGPLLVELGYELAS